MSSIQIIFLEPILFNSVQCNLTPIDWLYANHYSGCLGTGMTKTTYRFLPLQSLQSSRDRQIVNIIHKPIHYITGGRPYGKEEMKAGQRGLGLQGLSGEGCVYTWAKVLQITLQARIYLGNIVTKRIADSKAKRQKLAWHAYRIAKKPVGLKQNVWRESSSRSER